MRSPPVKSAARVIEVLELFSADPRPHSLKELSVKLAYPQSSTTVLMKSLMSLGYLNYDPARRVYFPTLRVTSLGDWSPNALFGEGRIAEVMRSLHAATGETVAIAVLNDVYIQYIKVIQSTHALRFVTPEGSMRVATRSAAGWMLLSMKKDAEVDKLVRRANIATASVDERFNVADFVRLMPRIRRERHAYSENVPLLGAATLCVPLPLTLQGQPVVLGLGGLAERIRPQRAKLVRMMQRCAAASAGEGDADLAALGDAA